MMSEIEGGGFEEFAAKEAVIVAEPMAIEQAIIFLRDKTSLARFTHDEVATVFDFMKANGFGITKDGADL